MSLQDEFEGDQDSRCLVQQLLDDDETARVRRERGPTSPEELAVEALPTTYYGTTFRSALEASWAATLDSLAITWEYEPRTFTLPNGSRYLPDFHLPEIGVWMEVKGDGVPRVEKAYALGEMLACDCPRMHCTCRWPGGELVLVGKSPKAFDPWSDETYDHWPARSKMRLSWNHGGHPRWTSTRGRRSWLTGCSRCNKAGWFDVARCRACGGPLVGSHGIHSGSDELQFIRISAVAVTAGDEEATE